MKFDLLNVQIPLWTIVTLQLVAYSSPFEGSDSSMDDCNGLQERRRKENKKSSDSSMDDCNSSSRFSQVM